MVAPAGLYDPVKATIYKQVTTYSNNEPIRTPTQLCQRAIRFPKVFDIQGGEQLNRHLMISTGLITIRLRKDSITTTIDPSMEIHHRGRIFGIVKPNPIMDLDELEFLCQYRTESQIVTS